MKTKSLLFAAFCLATALACSVLTPSAPAPAGGGNAPAGVETGTPTPYGGLPAAATGETPPVTAPPSNLPPADLPFYIDCSAIDPSKQPACDAYIAATRDLVYPILREQTGVSLSSCYDAVYYTISPDDQPFLPDGRPFPEAVGLADYNRIYYMQAASVDGMPLFDVHEMIHTIAFCTGALDGHAFHWPFENEVRRRLTGQGLPGNRESAVQLMEANLQSIRADSNLASECMGYLTNLVVVMYHDQGIEPIKRLYRSTILPVTTPAQGATPAPYSDRFKLLADILERDFHYQIDIPQCGY